jgi:hypothetical protein
VVFIISPNEYNKLENTCLTSVLSVEFPHFVKRKDTAWQDFFLYAPKTFNAKSLFSILQALATYSGDEIKAHVWDVGGVWRKEEYIQIFSRKT